MTISAPPHGLPRDIRLTSEGGERVPCASQRGQVKDTEIATDDVTDSIVHIEMYRQIATKEAGLAVSSSEALRKLQELLDAERAALQRQESGAGHSANIDALMIEIEKVRKLARAASPRGLVSRELRPGQQQVPRQNARPTPARNKGRRTTGRSGDR